MSKSSTTMDDAQHPIETDLRAWLNGPRKRAKVMMLKVVINLYQMTRSHTD
jgi:hypothetical protein